MTETKKPTIGIIGGTGKQGKGLAYRFATAGYPVIIGSRDPLKAEVTAGELNSLTFGHSVLGMDQTSAAIAAEVIIFSVPFQAHTDTLKSLAEMIQDKLIIDVAVPLDPAAIAKYKMPKFGSAALEVRQIVGDNTKVVDAFQHIGYEHFFEEDTSDLDVLICGSPKTAREQVSTIVADLGFHPVDAGPIENSIIVEGITPLLIHMNKTYKRTGLSVQIKGL